MRAAVWNDKGTLDVVEREVPEPRPGWVRVRSGPTGICGSDLHFYRGEMPSPKGLQPGHETGGVIDAVGEGVTLAPGVVVAVEPQTGCGTCLECRTGEVGRCANKRLFGMTARGGLAEYFTVPAECAYPLPEGVPPEAAGLAEPMAVCVRAVHLGRIGLGQRVAILGGGTVGLICILAARAAGASEILITARHPHQQERARAFGADAVFPDTESLRAGAGGTLVDCVLETVGGRASTLVDAVQVVRPGGTVVMLGVFEGVAPIQALDFCIKEVTMVGSVCYGLSGSRPEFAVGVELLKRYLPELQSLVTHRFSLERINEAFETAVDKRSGSIKVHVLPNG